MSEILSQMYIDLRVNNPLLLPDVNETLILLTYFGIILQYKITYKSSNRSRFIP